VELVGLDALLQRLHVGRAPRRRGVEVRVGLAELARDLDLHGLVGRQQLELAEDLVRLPFGLEVRRALPVLDGGHGLGVALPQVLALLDDARLLGLEVLDDLRLGADDAVPVLDVRRHRVRELGEAAHELRVLHAQVEHRLLEDGELLAERRHGVSMGLISGCHLHRQF
jgi:hypothetical protein